VTRNPVLQWLFWPAAALYRAGVQARAAAYRRGLLATERLTGKVISVGNLTVGGTGKTPMVMWLAEHLLAEGKRVAILTRGYRGKPEPGSQGVASSDEVALLRERLPRAALLGVGADRFARGRMLERHGVEWFLLDDGFQHLRLAREVDIVLLDATDPFGSGRLIPSGRLREPRTALRRASVVVITRSDRAPGLETVVRRFTNAPIFYAQTELCGAFDSKDDARRPSFVDCRGRRLFAFCAIGNPQAFFDDLRRWGFTVVGESAFRDHHRLTERDAGDLNRAALRAGAEGFICTEKDLWNGAARCAGHLPVWICRINLHLTDAEGFWRTVRDQAERNALREGR
jgi:tetraacyldisaccharide 4'-kinase